LKVHFDLPRRVLRPSALSMGSFDGVHRGHVKVLERLTSQAHRLGAESVVVTFDPHPRCVLTPDGCPPMLTTVDEKAELMGGLGIDHLVVLPFTRQLSQLTATEFMDRLMDKIPLRGMVIGYDFAFGHQRRGNREFLQHLGPRRGFEVEVVAAHATSGRIVSSSEIRRLLLEGHIPPANRLLGRDYSIISFVEHGTGTGSRIGYPTANFAVTPNKLIPRNGVYAVWIDIQGVAHEGAMNIGYRPTFGENRLTVEAFILDFDDTIYQEDIRARFVRRIRDEKRFESVDALVAQIGRDVARVRTILARDR
jgi:riboflavin kinase/FMN adenylyltransferase